MIFKVVYFLKCAQFLSALFIVLARHKVQLFEKGHKNAERCEKKGEDPLFIIVQSLILVWIVQPKIQILKVIYQIRSQQQLSFSRSICTHATANYKTLS